MVYENNDLSNSTMPPHTSQKTKEQWMSEAKEHQRIGNYEEALVAIDQAIQLDPNDAYIYKEKGNLLYDLQHYEEALVAFEHDLYLDPEDSESNQKKIDILILLGRYNLPTAQWPEPDQVKTGWAMVNTPYCQDICERMLGFSLPRDNQVVLISYEGIHIINLQVPEEVQNDYNYPEGGNIYDHEDQILKYDGKEFQILGVSGGKPILYSQFGERILFTPNTAHIKDQQRVVQAFKVQGDNGRILFEYQFEDISGDWAYCSFSADSNYIVFGAPYDFYLFQRVQ